MNRAKRRRQQRAHCTPSDRDLLELRSERAEAGLLGEARFGINANAFQPPSRELQSALRNSSARLS